MSAFMCDDTHLTILAGAIVKFVQHPSKDRDTFVEQVRKVARELHVANWLSVSCRYGERADAMETFVLDVAALDRAYSAMDLIQSAHCYRYQACEAATWEASEENEWTMLLIVALTRALPGAHGGAWGAPAPVSRATPGHVQLWTA